MNTQLEVRTSIKSTILYALVTDFITGGAIYFWKGILLYRSFTLQNIFIVVIMGFATVYAIWVWIPLFDRRPYLKFTPEGLWLRNTANPFQQLHFIPWDTLYFFHFYTQKRRNVGTDYVAFRQKDAEKDIDIVISGADTSAEMIAQVLNEYSATYYFYDLGYDTRTDH